MLFNSWFVPFFEMRFNFQISKYFSRENDTVQISDRLFFFSGKHLSPCLQKQHICFAARLGFIAFQGRQSQTNTFSSQIYAFSSCSLLVFSFFNFWGERFDIWFCSTSTSLKGDCISNGCIWKRCWKDMILPRIWGEQRFRKNESEL